MKHLVRLCAGVVLTLAFALPAFAGQIPCPGITGPPTDPESRATTTGETGIEVAEVAVTLLQDVLAVL